MSDFEDLDLNEFFSSFPLPDSPSLLPFLPEDLEPQPHDYLDDYPNSHVPSNTMEFSGYFAELDGGVFMPESQTLTPAPHDPASLVDDVSNIYFSAGINETPSDFIDPTLLDMPFTESFFFYGENNLLDAADIEQLESTITPSAIEGLEGQVMEAQNVLPSASELSLQPNLEATSNKRKLLGPSREYKVPPKKKRGRTGALTPAERNNLTKRGNACILCRMKKGKCSGEIPCDSCLNNLGPQLCTRPTFLDVVEEKFCFKYSSYLYQRIFFESGYTPAFLELFNNVGYLLNQGFTLRSAPDLSPQLQEISSVVIVLFRRFFEFMNKVTPIASITEKRRILSLATSRVPAENVNQIG